MCTLVLALCLLLGACQTVVIEPPTCAPWVDLEHIYPRPKLDPAVVRGLLSVQLEVHHVDG